MVKNTISYKYYIKDHLGNNRVVSDHEGNVMQYTNYYPYGGMLYSSTEPGYQNFKYNGKEYDTMHGLNEYDYGARQYDPAIAQFTSMDPLCEKYYHISPYAYCGGNPVNYIDPSGLESVKSDSLQVKWSDFNPENDYVELNDIFVTPQQNGIDYSQQGGFDYMLFTIGTGLTIRKELQYSEKFNIWTGKNGVLYHGLSGKGPNKYTGSRKFAKMKALKINKVGLFFNAITMYQSYKAYENEIDRNIGPNLKKYYTERQLRDQFFNALGFCNLYGVAASLAYNIGYAIEDISGVNIQLNPYTLDFTPIEQTLQEADEMGIIIY